MTQHRFQVNSEDHAQRLDLFLVSQLGELLSRTHIKKLIDAGLVTVNQKAVKAHYQVAPGDCIEVDRQAIEERKKGVVAENIPLEIFYEDPRLLVVHKPIGMLSHPVHGCQTGTLVNALLHYCDSLSNINVGAESDAMGREALYRPGIVHRLDRDTSGLMIVAKDDQTHVRLARQFEKHRIKKKYVALVRGDVDFEEGVVDAPLKKHTKQFDKRCVAFDDSGKTAKTFYRVLKRFEGVATLVALYPETGRTHQLRVHMAYLGHPIMGDEKYGSSNTFARMALHAQSIAFLHPYSKKWMECSTSLPEEFLSPSISS